SSMARTEDSRRVEDARHSDLRTDRLPHPPETTAAAQPDLEDVSAQSPRSNGLDGLLHRAHDQNEGSVRVARAGTSSSRGVAFQCDRASLCGVDIAAARGGLRRSPAYLIRDRDSIYGNEVGLRIASLQMEEVLTAPQSPWQNPYAERLIGSIR